MRLKKIIIFFLAVGISLFAASHRWGDSAHSIGLVKAGGGEARHPASLESGKDHYMLITTARVIPPYRGDARAVLEGAPETDYELFASAPVIDLGIRRLPEFRENIFYGLHPEDRLALWVEMKSPALDPVCGMQYGEGFIGHSHKGEDNYFCSEGCRDSFLQDPEKYRGNDRRAGKYVLAFYDMKTGNSVLRVPIIFKGKGDTADAGGSHH